MVITYDEQEADFHQEVVCEGEALKSRPGRAFSTPSPRSAPARSSAVGAAVDVSCRHPATAASSRRRGLCVELSIGASAERLRAAWGRQPAWAAVVNARAEPADVRSATTGLPVGETRAGPCLTGWLSGTGARRVGG